MHITRIISVTAVSFMGLGANAMAADRIYSGDPILTMAGPEPACVETLAANAGKIVFVGSRAEALKLQTPETELVDLQGHALLPGFIYGHGHMVYSGKNMIDGDLVGVASVSEMIDRITVQGARMGPEGWIVGFGCRVPSLAENRHPTAEELDRISPDRPIMVVGGSSHNGAANSALLRLLGLDKDTPDPKGGSYGRNADGSLPGEHKETALFAVP
jgi:predicted amidohydrolase YtcJ